MCTAVSYKTKDFYFGRNLDYEFSYHEEVVITPRNFILKFKKLKTIKEHFAFLGMAYVVDNYPLYYDGCNEKGLAIAGLNFVGNACYHNVKKDKKNIAQYEFIPLILATCSSVKDAINLIKELNILKIPFSKSLPVAKLHYLISDKHQSITVEPREDGIKIYDNPVGVLTNNPPFDVQLFALNNYLNVSNEDPLKNKFLKTYDINIYSRGMGGIGLPGDLSSQSRFVKASFVKMNAISKDDEISSVNQFFHILHSVEQQRGVTKLEENKYEITIYSSCMNPKKGLYYYTTYNNHQINVINMFKTDLNSDTLFIYPLNDQEKINFQN